MEKEHPENLTDYTFLYNTAPCGILTFEINGPINQANQTLLNWLGISKEEILDKKFTHLLDKAGVMYYELFVQPILKMHQEAKEINLNIQTSQGVFSCLFNGVVVNKKEGGGEIINAIIFKVEDRKKYENELLLKRTKAEEEKQLKAKVLQEVSFSQAHLVRAPLANILALITFLEQIDHQDEETKQIVGMLQVSAAELDKQVRAIVDKADLNI
ncbi:PAS domain-containing protein [Adhaeribacter radiodurans]|uniref:PAS domain S-box protein n=1 Tax=Adhaeribacter radiodurans TaxID=2745197 RepID=A0A7L7LCJ2_9BACT|nr:PAS domain-containing protein [Adhaeribacter radiodurans]QMU30414.1 PAS domain S-box protein [Adhaeribacter radiodurans]